MNQWVCGNEKVTYRKSQPRPLILIAGLRVLQDKLPS